MNRRDFLRAGAMAVAACACGTCRSLGGRRMGGAETLRTACCGIDCTDCGIRKAANDPAEAEREAARWRARGHAEAAPEWFQCQGCHGPSHVVWSQKRPIRACAKERTLSNCSQCGDFPCEKVTTFENDGSPHHREAVQRLRTLAAGGS